MSQSWQTTELERLLQKTLDQAEQIGELQYEIDRREFEIQQLRNQIQWLGARPWTSTTNGKCEVQKTKTTNESDGERESNGSKIERMSCTTV